MSSGSASDRLLRSPDDRFAARLSERRSSLALQEKLIRQERSNLDAAFQRLLAEGSVVQAAGAVVAARRRFVSGSGKSLAYATLLAADLGAGVSGVTLVDDATVRMVDVLTEVRSSDVLVVFSLRRYRRNTVQFAAGFAAAGGTVVAITDEPDSPVARVAQSVVVVPTESASFADSPTAVAAVCHLLSTLVTASAKGARRRLADRDRVARELELYTEETPAPGEAGRRRPQGRT
ncbi:SIS domain-containing protein [Gryllotalpicola koreensis]|uniref:SIS domain-containing protein n=1 Tax=Gryllotalpicola koreensis TaxID=993086 RepID=A0ABP7ZTM7_9MICO